jgi:hypothetical protein
VSIEFRLQMVGEWFLLIPQPDRDLPCLRAKDNISFSIDFMANAPSTSSDLAELLKELLGHDRVHRTSPSPKPERLIIANQRDRSSIAPLLGPPPSR